MRYQEIIREVRDHSTMEVYHFTSADGLRNILKHDVISIGASKHVLGDRELYGVSTTRNPFFNIENTYAISGKKAWRIGLDYRKLKQRFKVIPIRDEYLRALPRGVRKKSKLFGNHYTHVGHDENEEFVIGDITPLSNYITSIAVEDNFVDLTLHPNEYRKDADYYEEEYQIEGDDQYLLFDILSSMYEGEMEKIIVHPRHGVYHPHHITMNRVPFYFIDRDSHQSIPVETRFGLFNKN